MSLENEYTEEELQKINEHYRSEMLNLWIKEQSEQLNCRMSEELEAGLYCVGCSSTKLIELLKAFCWTELEVITTDKLDEFYRHSITTIKTVLDFNENVKKLNGCSEILDLIKLLPDVLTNSSLRITNWEEVMQTAFKIDSKISKLCYLYETYTASPDDPYISKLREIREYLPTHWQMREARTEKEIIDKVKKTNPIDMGVNSKLVRQKYRSEKIVAEEEPESKIRNLKQIYELGDLVAYQDGSITSKEKSVKLTPQQKRLHRLFFKNHEISLLEDSIKNTLKTKSKDKKIAYKSCSSLENILKRSAGISLKEKIIHCDNKSWVFKNSRIKFFES